MPAPDPLVANRIRSDIAMHDVVLYMKGTPVFPQCSGSAQAVQILNILGVRFKYIDILAEPGLRQGIKDFSDWPLVPQIFIKGEFIGSADILREMLETGELQELLAQKGVDFETPLKRA